MRRFLPFIILIVPAVLVSCSFSAGRNDRPSFVSASSSSFQESVNGSGAVSTQPAMQAFQGMVEMARGGVAVSGTHRLLLSNGTSVFLRSEAQDLNSYIGQSVEVRGFLSDAPQFGNTVLNVREIQLMTEETSSETVASSSSSSVGISSSSMPEEPSNRISSSASTRRNASSSQRSSQPAAVVTQPSFSSQPTAQLSSETQVKVKKMSTVKSETAWTLQYCSPPSIGFCFPVRGDWYFHSFGKGTAFLWHVEVSSQELSDLGDGPIVVNLAAGRIPEGIGDQSLVENGGYLTGYRAWTGNRHFEVSGPLPLRPSLEYITRNIIPFEQ
ncbi:hypothetical protein HY285_05730 [Candidatus Peregrinibacteria bacterium]|nr:hypothetical protein [Candidatus Peregrinibacteria bacterium]MBI3817007.1 hypothetical protein [Candidatus Peregrinibacteria bacterium]